MNDRHLKEEQLTLELLDAIGKNSEVSQRHLAKEMGVALGLANSYMKRCLRKGFIKINEAPANRYLYYLTPTGFAEKSRLTAKYLYNSLMFYRKAGDSCLRAYQECRRQGWNRVVICGMSDLAEIASLKALELNIDVVGVYDPGNSPARCINRPVCHSLEELDAHDVYLLTDLVAPQAFFDRMAAQVSKERLLVPDILGVDTGRKPGDGVS